MTFLSFGRQLKTIQAGSSFILKIDNLVKAGFFVDVDMLVN